MQTRWHSFIESWANVVAGIIISYVANLFIFPFLGYEISTEQNIKLVAIYTVISLVRSYVLRRLFNKWHVKTQLNKKG